MLSHNGSVAIALGIHCLTATLMVINGLLTMRETGKLTADQARPAPQPRLTLSPVESRSGIPARSGYRSPAWPGPWPPAAKSSRESGVKRR